MKVEGRFSTVNPFIVKVFEASTGHISKEDDAILKSDDVPLAVYEYEYGHFIYTGYPDELPTYNAENLFKAGFSREFVHLLVTASQNGCKFLQLDCDGTEYEDLKKFEW